MYGISLYDYRKQHPKCRYCKYSVDIALGVYYCNAKYKYFACNAKKCPLYDPQKEV